MVRRRSGKQAGDAGATPNDGATIGHEAELWSMADALRGSMDAAEYKHIVLGLIFLKYISDGCGSSSSAAQPVFAAAARQEAVGSVRAWSW